MRESQDPSPSPTGDSVPVPNATRDLVEVVAALLEADLAQREALIARLGERDAQLVRARLAALGDLGLALDDPASAHGLPRRLGRFVRLERVGVGGMGEVHLARDEESGELAAIKFLRPEHLWFEAAHERFRREVEAMVPLAHPGIVRVLESGEEQGVPWLALEWVGGASLEQVLDRLRSLPPDSLGPSDFEEAVRAVSAGRTHAEPAVAGAFPGRTYSEVVTRVVVRVARALAHAHAAGVLHRDVKPANVLVTPAGRVLLADFGLALPRGVDRMTRAGSWLGSLPYAAPEQIEGDSRPVDGRADVYSLGALLYELLTLRTPFLGGTEQQVRRRIATADLERPRSLTRKLPGPIEIVCLAALDLEPGRRPAGSAEMADDLERALSGRPIRVRPASPLLRAQRWVRRHPLRSATLFSSALVVLMLAGFAVREFVISQKIARLVDHELVRGLIEDAREFWPADPARLHDMDAWLERAHKVLDRRPSHEAELSSLRGKALPYDEADRRRDQASALEQFGTLARELDALAALVGRSDEGRPLEPRDPAVIRARDREIEALLQRAPSEILAAIRAQVAAVRESARSDPARWARDLEQVRDFDLIAERCAHQLEERETLRFAEALDAWRFGALRRLLADWNVLTALEERVRLQHAETERLAQAEAVEGPGAWQRARAAIARSPRYQGLELEPVFGLEPLGEDPRSGLWEFLLATTGVSPVRDESTPSGWRVEGGTGIVLVLLPGGRATIGQPRDSGPVRTDAHPAHAVELDPFLISKFELTRAQAQRLGTSPGSGPLLEEERRPMALDWHQARTLLGRVGLELPTEAQWEYAARGGEDGPWPIEGHANVLDATMARAWRRQGFELSAAISLYDDGWVDTAPVGSFAPNRFGLHDTLGNVWEWCQDPFVWRGYASLVPRSGDGLRDTVAVEGAKVVRGGAFSGAPELAQPWRRNRAPPASRNPDAGVRPVLRLPRRGS